MTGGTQEEHKNLSADDTMIQMWQPIALLLQQSIQSCIIYQKCNYRKYRPHIKLQINII